MVESLCELINALAKLFPTASNLFLTLNPLLLKPGGSGERWEAESSPSICVEGPRWLSNSLRGPRLRQERGAKQLNGMKIDYGAKCNSGGQDLFCSSGG